MGIGKAFLLLFGSRDWEGSFCCLESGIGKAVFVLFWRKDWEGSFVQFGSRDWEGSFCCLRVGSDTNNPVVLIIYPHLAELRLKLLQ